MKKVKVVYDRDKCIGAVTCHNLNPENWVMSREDGKADLLNAKKEGDVWVLETELDMYLGWSADQCPASVIEIFDIETGERLHGTK